MSIPAKDKAEELYYTFYSSLWYVDEESRHENAKDCVKMMVEDILQSDRITLTKENRGWWEQVLNQANKIQLTA